MKNFLLLFSLSVLFFTACNEKKETPKISVKEIKTEVNLLLNNWHNAAAEANYENYFNSLANTSIYIGTDASENWTKKEFSNFCKPYFDKGKAWDFKPLERNIYTSNNKEIVWFDELLNTWMGTCRGSGVLEKNKNNEWKIKHYVLSVEIPNNDIKKVIDIKKVQDSVFLSKFK